VDGHVQTLDVIELTPFAWQLQLWLAAHCLPNDCRRASAQSMHMGQGVCYWGLTGTTHVIGAHGTRSHKGCLLTRFRAPHDVHTTLVLLRRGRGSCEACFGRVVRSCGRPRHLMTATVHITAPEAPFPRALC
jgi:hypothetical protein